MLKLILLFLWLFRSGWASEEEGGILDVDVGGEEEEIPPAHAVLFPSFVLTLGVLVFYVLTR